MLLLGKPRLLPAAVVFLVAGWICAVPASSGVVVLVNHSAKKVEFTIVRPDRKTSKHSLDRLAVLPIPMKNTVRIVLESGGTVHRVLLRANSVHYFVTRNDKLRLLRLKLPLPDGVEELPPPADSCVPDALVHTIPVMILADDNEPAVRQTWEKRFRDRVAEASKIFEHYCRIRFEVVAVGTWVTDNQVYNFSKALREFELKVAPTPAQLAIGFTSQYKISRGQTHLGGTRGPLHSHILIREWAQHISKTERLEVLVHELGHFLGAAHSRQSTSAMRPKLGDRRSYARGFQVGFDGPNTMIMYLLGEELRSGRYRGFSRLQPGTKAALRSAYLGLSKVLPADPSTKNYLKLLDRSPYVRPKKVQHPKTLVDATRTVVQAIGEAAKENRDAPAPLSGDRLTEFYFRRAAAAADKLPPKVAPKAFLLGLAIAVDDSGVLRHAPGTSELCRQAESDQQRLARLAALGSPTMRGRRDLAKHFALSSALTVLIGPQCAEAAGVVKELKDSHGRSGFSFVDLLADFAGVKFATEVHGAKISLATLAASFAAEDFLPEASGLEEGISWSDFVKTYKSAQGGRFHHAEADLRKRILEMPGYKSQ